jgi:glycosyltransferase involved in cell wall biosynthesis
VEKKQRYILYQGAVNEGRGLEMLLEVMPEMDAELWICGKGEMLESLQQRALELKIENKVKFLGYVLPADLEKITREAYIGFNLLENLGLSYYYSLSNKFFDYLHAAIPQVVIDFPEYKTLLQEFEVGHAIPLEKEALKSALQELLTDEKRYDFLVKNCLLARETWNWQQEEKRLLSLYESLWQTPQKVNS